jgi:hypothetical protein
MAQNKQWWRSRMEGVLDNTIASIITVILIGVVPLVVSLVYAWKNFYSTNREFALLLLLVVLVGINTLLIASLLWRQSGARGTRRDYLVHDDQKDAYYLVDAQGRLREIPDVNTFSFLRSALDIDESVPVLPSQDISQSRGEKLVSIKDWKPPLSPEEQQKRDLQLEVTQLLELPKVRFDEASEPQSIIVLATNKGREPIYVKHISFLPYNQVVRVSYEYQRTSHGFVIPLQPTTIAPGGQIEVQINLLGRFRNEEIEGLRGRLGAVRLDVVYRGVPLEDILIVI